MNGNFEQGTSAYPIGYLESGEIHGKQGYKLTDMRALKHLHNQVLTKEQAVAGAKSLNAQYRDAGFLRDHELTQLAADYCTNLTV